jgi:hypothetical protein
MASRLALPFKRNTASTAMVAKNSLSWLSNLDDSVVLAMLMRSWRKCAASVLLSSAISAKRFLAASVAWRQPGSNDPTVGGISSSYGRHTHTHTPCARHTINDSLWVNALLQQLFGFTQKLTSKHTHACGAITNFRILRLGDVCNVQRFPCVRVRSIDRCCCCGLRIPIKTLAAGLSTLRLLRIVAPSLVTVISSAWLID